ncbi:SDR family NAD(P)-dependent oxidoreductase [Streptomyces sp. NPDC002685]|uniref:SDR family NAD(P)-dependent oxidoreductase n=1 Tax=Streptomyces sp. NPDC002685 TaxID=3154540 RepID=UPI00332CF84C
MRYLLWRPGGERSSTSPSAVAVVGAGANLGRAIARRFGTADHPVAQISRNRDKLEAVAASLAEEGITTGFYPADATDAKALTTALDAAAGDLGRIGVLSYSPAPVWDHSGGGLPDLAANQQGVQVLPRRVILDALLAVPGRGVGQDAYFWCAVLCCAVCRS